MRSNPIVDATANVREYGHLTAKPHSGDSSSDKRIDASFNSPPKMHTDIAGRDSSRTVFLYTSNPLSTQHQKDGGHKQIKLSFLPVSSNHCRAPYHIYAEGSVVDDCLLQRSCSV